MWCALIIWAMWACYAALIEQTGSSLNLFTARLVDLHLAGFEIQASQMQGATTSFLLVASPFFAWLWVYLDRRGLNPPTPPKLAIAIFALAAGFFAIALGALFPDSAGKISIGWLILTWLLFGRRRPDPAAHWTFHRHAADGRPDRGIHGGTVDAGGRHRQLGRRFQIARLSSLDSTLKGLIAGRAAGALSELLHRRGTVRPGIGADVPGPDAPDAALDAWHALRSARRWLANASFGV